MAIEASSSDFGGGTQETADAGTRTTTDRLVVLLGSQDSDKRRCAAQLLGIVGHPAAIGPLGEAVNDPDPNVQRDAVMALRAIDDPRTLEPLVRVARGSNPFIGDAAVRAVGKIGGSRARDALIEIINDGRLDRNVRQSAAEELRRIGDPVAVAAAERHFASLRPQWHRAFYFGALLFVLAFMAGRPGSARMWVMAFYVAVAGSIIFLINPVWLIVGQEKTAFWGLALGYPLGLAIACVAILWVLRGFVSEETLSRVQARISRAVLVMWGTLALWVVAVFVLMLVGLGLAWR